MNGLQELLEKKDNGEMTMNQTYNYAIGDGSFSGSFKEFMNKAQQSGWVDQGLGALSGIARNKWGGSDEVQNTICPEGSEKDENGICVPIKKGMSTIAIVGISVAVIGLIAGGIYLAKKK
jgi:hypothetical protein